MTAHSKTSIQEIADAFDRLISPISFVRKGRRLWQRKTNDISTLVGFEKSPWGNQYYLEIGFILRDAPAVIGNQPAANPKVHHAHVRLRGEELVPAWRGLSAQDIPLNQWLDTENDLDLAMRIEQIDQLVQERLLPLLERYNSFESLKTAYKQGLLRAALIHPTALPYLEASGEGKV